MTKEEIIEELKRMKNDFDLKSVQFSQQSNSSLGTLSSSISQEDREEILKTSYRALGSKAAYDGAGATLQLLLAEAQKP